ncbi:MAG TPA: ABC transporter substrate-binding protein, partial [Propionibacteriaceae bacterium]|nr:ABC transporter substrate-binding protein [Propionibacteriaceae bacterium]
MRVKIRALAAAAGASLALLAACGGGNTTNPQPGTSGSAGGQAGGDIVVRGCTPQKALLPASTSETCGGNILDNVLAKLVHYNSENAAPEND